jgi:ABC-type glycerol-3-phosphate transport system permease component
MTFRSSGQLTSRLGAVLLLGVWAVACIFPLYWNVVAALLPVEEIFSDPPRLLPTDPTLQNFVDLGTAIPTLAQNIRNSVILAIAIPAVNVFISTLAGFAFAKLKFRGREWLFYAIVGTMAVPPLIGYVPLYLTMTSWGLADSLWAVFFPSLIGAFGIFLFRQTMESIPDELFDAARIDGASNFTIYRLVALPLVVPMAITQFTVGFLAAFNDYFWPLIILRSPEAQTFPVALASIQGQFFNSPWGQIMAGSALLMIPAIVIFAMLSRYIVPNTTAGALKG